MKMVSVAEAQHNLSQILKYVDQGEEVAITRRKKVVAKIVLPAHAARKTSPDFESRAREIFGTGRGTPASEVVSATREERT